MHPNKIAFLIDENLPVSLRDAIRLAGFVAYRLSDVGLKGVKDSVVARALTKPEKEVPRREVRSSC